MLTALHRVYVRVTCCLLDAAIAREPRGLVFHFEDNMTQCKGKLSRPQHFPLKPIYVEESQKKIDTKERFLGLISWF